MDSEALAARIQSKLSSTPNPGASNPGSRPPPPIPDHELLARIGAGSYGEVWLARGVTGGLRAVKIVWRHSFSSDRPYDREFRGIVQFEPISRSHPGVVNVLHVGRDEAAGCFFYVMELADDVKPERGDGVVEQWSDAKSRPTQHSNTPGHQDPNSYVPRTLASDLRARGRIPVIDSVTLGVQLANALGHLHRHGLVHRDVKPSNVIFVNGQAKLADIGLVAGMDEARSFVGTEGFIAPEGPGSEQADLFSLGRLLYEMATGQDRSEFPMLPADLDRWPGSEREILLELNEVLARACAANPKDRHANAAALASDLNVILAGRSVRRAYGIERRLRNATRVSIAAIAVAALSGGVVWFLEAQRRQSESRAAQEARLRTRAETAEREAQQAQANEAQGRRRAEAQELAARKKAYASDMKLLQVALAADDLGRAQELLNRQRPQPGEKDLRGWEWRYLWQFCQGDEAFTLCKRSTSILSLSFSRDGALLAAGGVYPSEVTIWDVGKRQLVSSFENLPHATSQLAFAPNSDMLAFYNASNRLGHIVLWDARNGKELHRLPATAFVESLAFTHDGRLFAGDISRPNTNNVKIWDPVQGNVIASFRAARPNGTYNNSPHFAISADGARFAHVEVGGMGFVQVTDANGRAAPRFRVTEQFTRALVFSPDGETLVTAGDRETTIKLWDVSTRQLIGTLDGHQDWVCGLKFLPDGKTLASSSADRTIRLWNFETRQPIRTLRGHGGELWTLAVSPDGRWVAGGGKDGSVLMWDLASSTNRPAEYRTPVDRAGHFDYSPDGRLLAVTQEQRLKLYDATTFQLVSEPALPPTNIVSFAFSPDTRLLVVTVPWRHLACWDLQEQRMVTNFMAGALEVARDFDPNGKSVLTRDPPDLLTEWDVTTWKQIRQWRPFTNQIFWAYSPAADLVGMASMRMDGACALLPIRDPDKERRFTGQTRIVSVAFSPDGKTFAAASQNGTVELWDTETLTRQALLRGVVDSGFSSVTFSPDGQRVMAGGDGKESIKLWELHSHEDVATLIGEGRFFRATFSPDGNTIAARNGEGLLHVWTAPPWSEVVAAEKARATVQEQ